jgi:hypothetical protein
VTERSLAWRTSTYSSGGGSCVAVARSPAGDILVRNSNHPDAGTLTVAAADMATWITACANGELDGIVH